MTTTTNLISSERDLDWNALKNQLGQMTVFAISGGRVRWAEGGAIELPVSSGYAVRITLAANDTYTVQRVMHRGTKTFIKGTVTGVYCDQVGDVAYVASNYKSDAFGDA